MGKIIWNHITARVPDAPDTILVFRLGCRYDEVTASNLVKMTLDGALVDAPGESLNAAAYVIHGGIYGRAPIVMCVMHTHSRGGQAVACLKDGLLPLSQEAMMFHGDTAYHDYEGISDDESESERLANDLGEPPADDLAQSRLDDGRRIGRRSLLAHVHAGNGVRAADRRAGDRARLRAPAPRSLREGQATIRSRTSSPVATSGRRCSAIWIASNPTTPAETRGLSTAETLRFFRYFEETRRVFAACFGLGPGAVSATVVDARFRFGVAAGLAARRLADLGRGGVGGARLRDSLPGRSPRLGRAPSLLRRLFRKQRHGVVERQRLDVVAVGHRRVDVAVLDVGSVAAREWSSTGLPVLRMLAEHAEGRRRPAAPRRAPALAGSRASNSKPIFPSGWRTRNAENGRLASAPTRTAGGRSCRSRAASPSARARPAAAGSRGPTGSRRSCPGPTAFSHTYACGISNTRLPHFGHAPSGTWPVKSGASASSSPAPSPKSNVTSFASISLSDGGERRAEPAAETFERTDAPLAQQRVGFGELELPAAHDLPEAERRTTGTGTSCSSRGLRRRTSGTRASSVPKSPGIVSLSCALACADDVLGHRDDLAHERGALAACRAPSARA